MSIGETKGSDLSDFLTAFESLGDFDKTVGNLTAKNKKTGPNGVSEQKMAVLKLGKQGEKELKIRFLNKEFSEKVASIDSQENEDKLKLLKDMLVLMKNGDVIFQRTTIKKDGENEVKEIEAFTSLKHQGTALIKRTTKEEKNAAGNQKAGEVITAQANADVEQAIKTVAVAAEKSFTKITEGIQTTPAQEVTVKEESKTETKTETEKPNESPLKQQPQRPAELPTTEVKTEKSQKTQEEALKQKLEEKAELTTAQEDARAEKKKEKLASAKATEKEERAVKADIKKTEQKHDIAQTEQKKQEERLEPISASGQEKKELEEDVVTQSSQRAQEKLEAQEEEKKEDPKLPT